MIQKFTISRDDTIYEAWPDVVLTPSGKLLCVFAECNHHHDRSYTRIMLTESKDRGRSWTRKRPLTDGTQGLPYYNCGRIMQLRDGRFVFWLTKFTNVAKAVAVFSYISVKMMVRPGVNPSKRLPEA